MEDTYLTPETGTDPLKQKLIAAALIAFLSIQFCSDPSLEPSYPQAEQHSHLT